MVGNARRWKEEVLTLQVPIGERLVELRAERQGWMGVMPSCRFWDSGDCAGNHTWCDNGNGNGANNRAEDPGTTFSELLEAAGSPYSALP